MKEYLKKALESRLSSILKFVDSKTKEYEMVDLQTKEKVKFLKVEDLPDEFTLLVGDKTLSNKGVSLLPEVDLFLKECNKTWEHFTGDNLHPVPNNIAFNKETYNPTLAYYAMKNKKVLWVKKCGEARTLYIKHILLTLKA